MTVSSWLCCNRPGRHAAAGWSSTGAVRWCGASTEARRCRSRSTAIQRRRSPRRVRLRKGLVGIRDGLPAHRTAVFDRPDVREPCIHLDSARAATATLVNDRNQPVAALDDLLRHDAEAVEALEPASEEALEAVASVMCPGFRAVARLVPLDLGVEKLQDDREVATVERLIPAPERFDVRLGHARSIAAV